MPTIAEVAKNAGTFQTLLKAVEAAGLSQALESEGPFTVFAPDDNAFKKVPQSTLEGLLKDTAKLKEILLYHVIPGKIISSQALQLTQGGKVQEVKTLQGQNIKLSQRGFLTKSLYVNDAKVVKPDIEASNGVIHVIDRVIMPQ